MWIQSTQVVGQLKYMPLLKICSEVPSTGIANACLCSSQSLTSSALETRPTACEADY